jgi:BirA family biotin operon repressor/biotin-[acetyl-CoA-carboxylase] ligase
MISTSSVVPTLKTLESIAVIPRVASTNLVARRIVTECIDNELSLPHAMIIAREQFAGRGRNDRTWSSPAGKGIYATTLIAKPLAELPLVPLEMANIVASFLRETFGVDTRIKWPNDVLAGGRKIAGILIEARVQESRAYLMIGTGINIEPVSDETRPNAVALREIATRSFGDLDAVTLAFIAHVDARLSRPLDRNRVLEEWRRLSVHSAGDPIACVVGDKTIRGTWEGIDNDGRALIRQGGTTTRVSAGDLILAT